MDSDQPLDHEARLQLITNMINQAKGNIQYSAFYFLLWGWVVLLGNTTHYCLANFTEVQAPFAAWLITIPAGFASAIYGYRKRKRKTHRSHYDTILGMIWLAFIIAFIVLQFSAPKVYDHISPMILLLAGVATFLTGVTIRYKPIVLGAIVFWACAMASFYSTENTQLILSSVAVIGGYLIPGYMLRNRKA